VDFLQVQLMVVPVALVEQRVVMVVLVLLVLSLVVVAVEAGLVILLIGLVVKEQEVKQELIGFLRLVSFC